MWMWKKKTSHNAVYFSSLTKQIASDRTTATVSNFHSSLDSLSFSLTGR